MTFIKRTLTFTGVATLALIILGGLYTIFLGNAFGALPLPSHINDVLYNSGVITVLLTCVGFLAMND